MILVVLVRGIDNNKQKEKIITLITHDNDAMTTKVVVRAGTQGKNTTSIAPFSPATLVTTGIATTALSLFNPYAVSIIIITIITITIIIIIIIIIIIVMITIMKIGSTIT